MSTQYIKNLNLNAAAVLTLAGLAILSALPLLSFVETAGQARENAAVMQRDALVALVSGH